MLFRSALIVFSVALPLVFGTELPPIPADLTTPYQHRIAFNGATGMSVGWSTFQQISNPTVYYGEHPHTMQRSASSTHSVTYPTSRQWSNVVYINGLKPATTYYYKIASTNSTMLTFKTARTAGDQTPFSFAAVIDMGVFGDMGLSERNMSYTGKAITNSLRPGEHTTIQRLVSTADQYEFVVHPGDFAYADAWLKELNLGYINGTQAEGPAIYEGLTELFFEQLGAVSGTKPYMVTAGNHEANCLNGGAPGEKTCPIGQTNFTGFINRYGALMPSSPGTTHLKRDVLETEFGGVMMKARAAARSVSGAVAPFWYSFDYGMAHFLMFDTEGDLGNGIQGPDEVGGSQNDFDGPFGSYMNQQIDFMENDLAAVNRNTTPWIIAAGHRPWYVNNGFPCWDCQKAFEPTLLKHNVDIAIFGHTHNMQRLGPVAYNVTDPAGMNNPTSPLYLVNGAAGHFEGLEILPLPQPSYLKWGQNGTLYGYNKINFLSRTQAEIQFISSIDGAVIDSSILYKKH